MKGGGQGKDDMDGIHIASSLLHIELRLIVFHGHDFMVLHWYQ